MAIEALINRMNGMLEEMQSDDPLRFFHGTYMRTTQAVAAELSRGGFIDNNWTERWDVAFADLYLEALATWQSGDRPPRPWQIALDACRGPRIRPLGYVLLGMNAHINYDLPQALLAVITDDEFEDLKLRELRSSDHAHIDGILASRVAAEDGELMKAEMPGDRTVLDVILTPFNRLGTKRFLAESRAKVWTNAIELSRARRRGPEALAARLHELEHLSENRVASLREPGQVILKLARHGFGVLLPNSTAGGS